MGEGKRKEDWYWREKVSKNGERAEGEEQVKMGGSGEEGRKGGGQKEEGSERRVRNENSNILDRRLMGGEDISYSREYREYWE